MGGEMEEWYGGVGWRSGMEEWDGGDGEVGGGVGCKMQKPLR